MEAFAQKLLARLAHATPSSRWTAAVALLCTPLFIALAMALWNVPYPISETVAILEDLERGSGAVSGIWDIQSPFFRPLFWGSLLAVWSYAPTTPAALTLYKVLHVTTVFATVAGFLIVLRPRVPADAAAATLAVAVLIGSPAFRDNLENLPFNQMAIIGLISIVVWRLVSTPGRWHAPSAILLTVAAIGFKEEGLIVGAVVVAAAFSGAPGMSRRAGLALTVLCSGYVGIRLWNNGAWPLFMQSVGFGFRLLKKEQATLMFGGFPYTVYVYSVMATAANVLFSEPTSGVFRITQALITCAAAPWQINHLLSSLAATGLVLWWAIVVVRAEGGTPERRVLIAVAVAIAASACLGFKYTRDRFNGVAMIFYAIAVFEAARAALSRTVSLSRRRMAAVGLGLFLLNGAWQLRGIGTLLYVRESTAMNHKEWLVDLRKRRDRFADRPVYLNMLDRLEAQGTDPQTMRLRPGGRWQARVFGER